MTDVEWEAFWGRLDGALEVVSDHAEAFFGLGDEDDEPVGSDAKLISAAIMVLAGYIAELSYECDDGVVGLDVPVS